MTMHLVMFDIDGTLVDSDEADGALYARAVYRVLGEPVDETWASYVNVTDSGILAEILGRSRFRDDADDVRSRVERELVESTREHLARNPTAIREIPGARALIELLLATPAVRVAVATGGWKETAFLKLAKIGLDPGRLAVATSSDAAERTTIMRIAEQRAMGGVPPSRKTYFGDGAWDRRASTELGYDFIGVGPRVAHGTVFADFSDHAAVCRALGI